MLILMTLTLRQGHSALTEANNQHYIHIISATKQAISIKLNTTVGPLLHDLTSLLILGWNRVPIALD